MVRILVLLSLYNDYFRCQVRQFWQVISLAPNRLTPEEVKDHSLLRPHSVLRAYAITKKLIKTRTFKTRLVLQRPLFGDVPSFFLLKVSKTFHKTANFFSVFFFLSLRFQSSQMLVVISWHLRIWFKLLWKSQY